MQKLDNGNIRIGNRDYRFKEEIEIEKDESKTDFQLRVERRRNNIRLAHMPCKTYVEKLETKARIYIEIK